MLFLEALGGRFVCKSLETLGSGKFWCNYAQVFHTYSRGNPGVLFLKICKVLHNSKRVSLLTVYMQRLSKKYITSFLISRLWKVGSPLHHRYVQTCENCDCLHAYMCTFSVVFSLQISWIVMDLVTRSVGQYSPFRVVQHAGCVREKLFPFPRSVGLSWICDPND